MKLLVATLIMAKIALYLGPTGRYMSNFTPKLGFLNLKCNLNDKGLGFFKFTY